MELSGFVRAAALAILAQGPSVAAWQADLVLLKDAAAKTGAVCLDGTPGAYYMRRGSGSGASKWYIHHEGGGWCESLDDCAGRSKTVLGSSSNYPASVSSADLSFFDYLSDDVTRNPMMYNWNAVYLKYCDGGSFSGNNETTTQHGDVTLHFRGKAILSAMQQDLLAKGLDEATDVVISGCSAGGLATYLHLDQWSELLYLIRLSEVKVVGMPDSGWFADYEGPPRYHTGLIWVFNQMNSTSGVNQNCIQAHQATGDEWKCIFAEHTAPHIQTPLFPLQGIFDTWQVDNELASKDPAQINAYGANMKKSIEQNLLAASQNGIFLDSCSHHCGGWSTYTVGGKTQAQAFQQWYEQGSEALPNAGYYSQNQTFPCQDCCQRPKEEIVI